MDCLDDAILHTIEKTRPKTNTNELNQGWANYGLRATCGPQRSLCGPRSFFKKTYALTLNHSWIELCAKYPIFHVNCFFLEITAILGEKVMKLEIK